MPKQKKARTAKAAEKKPGPKTFQITIPAAMMESFQVLAKVNRRPVASEIQRRLEIMLAEENFAKYMFGGEATLNFVLLIAAAIGRAEFRLGRRWFSDTSSIVQTKAAVMQEMSDYVLMRQLGPFVPPKDGWS